MRYSPSILVPLLELQFSPAVSTSLRDFPHFQLSIPAPSPASHPRVCKGTARAAAEKLGNVVGEPPSSGNAKDGAHPHGHQQAHRYFSNICALWYFLVKTTDLLPRHGAQEWWTCLTWMLLTLPTCELVSQEEIVAFSFHDEDWKNGLTWNCKRWGGKLSGEKKKKPWLTFLPLIHGAGNVRWAAGVKTRAAHWDYCRKSEFPVYAIFTSLCNPSPPHHIIALSPVPNSFPLFQPLQLSCIISLP